jgi:HEAT repeat protein
MSKKAFEQKLAALDELRQAGATPATAKALRKGLSDRNNYAAGKAARIVEELGLNALIPELVTAFHRFFENPVKSDPQCWAKNAISKALAALGHDDPEVFLRGLAYVQMEPVWGGQQDTAATLRGTCALALVQCRNLSDFEILARLTDVLVDPDKTVRVEAARAVGHLGRPEGALLLRLKALAGDKEPEVTGACFSALFAIEGRPAIPLMARFLEGSDEVAEEAATALGLTREPDAFQILKKRWERERHGLFAAVLVSATALTRLPEATEFLLQVVQKESPGAEAAIQALAGVHLPEDSRALIQAAAERSSNPRLRAAFDKHLGRS